MKVIRKYREFLEDTLKSSDFAILQGGKRAGKSVALWQFLYENLLRSKKKAIILTDTYSRLRDSVISDFQMITAENPRLTKITRGTGAYSIRFYNGSEINFVCSEKDTRGFTSNNDYIVCNEANMYEWGKVNDLLKAGGENCKVVFDYNPYTRFYVQDYYEKAGNKLITTYNDNPFIPKFAKSQLEEQTERGKSATIGTMDRYLYEVECLGIDSNLSGLCFPNAEIISEKEYMELNATEILCSDWGQSGATADPDVVVGLKIFGNDIYIHEYLYDNASTDDDIFRALSAKVPKRSQFFVYETATSGLSRINNLYAMGLRFRFVPAQKPPLMYSIREMKDYTLKITETSLNVRFEQQNYNFINRNGILQPADKNNHAMDAMRYGYFYKKNNKLL